MHPRRKTRRQMAQGMLSGEVKAAKVEKNNK
jgi:hypothetical protein